MISAVVLTHNDSLTIERTLESLTWCDETIIVDDYSTDTTLDLSRQYTKKIHLRHLNNDFASQRNFGLSKARGDWVLFVDSDEVVTAELAREIQKAISKKAGYLLKRRDFFGGRWLKYGETSRVWLMRLAKKDVGVWARPVHEVWQVNGDIGELKNPLLHYPHPNVAQFLEKINNYSDLNAQYLYSQERRVKSWEIVTYPAAKFLLNYFYNLGFLDGTQGAIMAIAMSLHSFLTRAKLRELWKS